METASRAEIVKLLSHAVDSWASAVGSGRLGFDHAVAEYVEQSDNVLSRAFAAYVEALRMVRETEPTPGKDRYGDTKSARRMVLLEIADQFDVPEVTSLVEALIESQDKELSIVRTLEVQAKQLHRPLSSA